MKKILLSMMAIAASVGMISLGTAAYFNDSEAVADNTFTTGTIDIAVDGQNPWADNETFDIEDMKPGQNEYTEFVIENVGSNPANVWKNLSFHDHANETESLPVSEPECVAEAGESAWNSTTQTCAEHAPVYNLEDVLFYDMKVGVYAEDPTGLPDMDPIWYQNLYAYGDGQDTLVGNIYPVTGEGQHGVYLGMVPAGYFMKVTQSYHMDPNAGNQYQGDSMQYDVSLYAEQLINTVYLDNKDTANDYLVTHNDNVDGTLTYAVKDRTFDYTLVVNGLTAGDYTLVAWEDPSEAWTWNASGTRTVLANVTVSGASTTVTGSENLNTELTNAKVWVVPGNLGTPGTTGVNLPWAPTQTLFEMGLMDYYDSLID